MGKTDRKAKRKKRRADRKAEREATGQKAPKLRRAASWVWDKRKYIPWRPFGGAAERVGETIEDNVKKT